MRDIKSAQKLKTHLSNSRYSALLNSYFIAPRRNSNQERSRDREHDHESANRDLKRSQTFSSATLPRQSKDYIYNNQNESEYQNEPTNSQHNFYPCSSTNNHFTQGILKYKTLAKKYSFINY